MILTSDLNLIIGMLFLLAITFVMPFVWLMANPKRWLTLRNIPYKVLYIETPSGMLIKYIRYAGDKVIIKIKGKQHTYFTPEDGTTNPPIYHYNYGNANPIIKDRKQEFPAPKSGDPKVKLRKRLGLNIFRGFYNSIQITELIANPSLKSYVSEKSKSKVSLILGLAIMFSLVTSLIAGYYGYTIDEKATMNFEILNEKISRIESILNEIAGLQG